MLHFGPLSSSSTAQPAATAAALGAAAKPGALTSATTGPFAAGGTTLPLSLSDNDTLGDIIKRFNESLEAQSKAFCHYAVRIQDMDTALLHSQDKLVQLNTEVQAIQQQQEALERKLRTIDQHQDQIAAYLQPLLDTEQPEDPQAQNSERGRMLLLCTQVNSLLNHTESKLAGVVHDITELHPRDLDSNPVDQITTILRLHLETLEWIDSVSQDMGNRIKETKTKLQVANENARRTYLGAGR